MTTAHTPPSATPVRLLPLGAAADPRWDELVETSPQGNAFLRSDWLAMLRDTDGRGLAFHRIGYFDKQDKLVGGWALPYRSALGLRYAAEGFEFFYAGPLLAPELATPDMHHIKQRHEVLTQLANTMRQATDLVVAETHPSLHDVRDFLYDDWVISPEYTHIWDMADPDYILQQMNREKRREIRRGMAEYKFAREEYNPSAFAEFMAVYRKTMRKFDWYPAHDWQLRLNRRLDWLRECDGYRLYTARNPSGGLAAGVLILLSPADQTAYLWKMGHDTDNRDSRVVPALYWSASMDIAENEPKLRYMNFGGSPFPSLGQFKDYLVGQPTLHFRLIHRRPSVRLGLWRLSENYKCAGRQLLARYPALDGVRRVFS